MQDESNSVSKALDNLRSDLRSVRGVIGRIPQLVALVLLCGMFVTIFHKLYVDIALIAEQHPNDFGKAVIRYFLGNM